MISLALLHHADQSLTTDGVDASFCRVEEDVIGISADREPRYQLSRVGVVDQKFSRLSDTDKESMSRFIQRHREVCRRAVQLPRCHDLALDPIQYRDVIRRRYVDEDAPAPFLELERLGMAGELELAGRVAGSGIERPQRALAVTDVDLTGLCVIAEVVRVLQSVDPPDRRKRGRVKDIDPISVPARYEQPIRLCYIGKPLRLTESLEAPDATPALQVDDLDGVVAERGNEQPLTCDIDSHVIDAAFDFWQRDGLNKLQLRCQRGIGRPDDEPEGNQRRSLREGRAAFSRIQFVHGKLRVGLSQRTKPRGSPDGIRQNAD